MEVGKMNNEQQKYVGWEAVQTPVPRLRIRTDEGEHFLIPWHMISLIKADLSLKMIELHTVSVKDKTSSDKTRKRCYI